MHKIEVRPIEYAKALQKLLDANPRMTTADLADRLHKNEIWVKTKLQLIRLIDEIAKMVDNGTICLASAYMFSKLSPEEQRKCL